MSRDTSDTCCAIVTRPIRPRHRYWPSANSTQWALHRGSKNATDDFLWDANQSDAKDDDGDDGDGADGDNDGPDGHVDTGEGAASARVALGKSVADAKKKEKKKGKTENEKAKKQKKEKEKEPQKRKQVGGGRNAANYHRNEAVPPNFYASKALARRSRKDESDTRSYSRAETLRANLHDYHYYCSMDLGVPKGAPDGRRHRACLRGTCLDDTCLRTCLTRRLTFPQVLKEARATLDGIAYDCSCDEHEQQMCSLCRVPALVVATTKGATTMQKGETVFVKHHVSSRPTVLCAPRPSDMSSLSVLRTGAHHEERQRRLVEGNENAPTETCRQGRARL